MMPVRRLGVLLLAAVILPAAAQERGDSGERCSLMEGTKRRLLALDYQAFDQQPQGGWRGLFEAGCPYAAADIVDAYIERHPERAADYPVLHFRAGQLRAFVGEGEAAVSHMQRAIAAHARGARVYGAHWETYVGATIAFLERDEPGLRRLYGRLRGRIDGPPGAPPRFDRSQAGDAEHIRIVRGLIACFDQSYREAYSNCRDR